MAKSPVSETASTAELSPSELETTAKAVVIGQDLETTAKAQIRGDVVDDPRMLRSDYGSWGRTPKAKHAVAIPEWRSDRLPPPRTTANPTLLPYGLGRSYGDSCLNDRGTLIDTRRLARFIAFDRATGMLTCEPGVTLAEILHLVVPQGWFLPVTPGTKFVTIGGAIANDVHGKNHHAAGTFGRFVRRFELLRSDGSRLQCAPSENPGFFGATIGGLGLTGLITWAELQLVPIHNPFMEAESVKFGSLDEFFEVNAASERDFTHTVAWVDCLKKGKALGRGLYNRGNHAGPRIGDLPRLPKTRSLSVPVDAPGFALNGLTVRAFNFAYYARQRAKVVGGLVPYHPFFYPLDAIEKWNRIYGRRGFFQYQFVVPEKSDALRGIFDAIARSGEGSFLAVLKRFGTLKSPGLMSFPRPGFTLALDFSNRGERTMKLFERLDAMVLEAGGAVYPAKDARMSGKSFRAFFPQWEAFSRYIDPRFSSSFWRRVTDT